ncbi:hypothetical protein BD770DRAFT_414960 [Pilaira anomala]|nr:hypothetical protein BD770DRAFT_414960 [Pilaira anomala]
MLEILLLKAIRHKTCKRKSFEISIFTSIPASVDVLQQVINQNNFGLEESKMFNCDAGQKFKLVMIPNDENIIDSYTGEMAKKATVTLLPYIRAQDVPLIKMPITQVAGFSGKLSSVISLPEKKDSCYV